MSDLDNKTAAAAAIAADSESLVEPEETDQQNPGILGVFKRRSKPTRDLDSTATVRSVFDDPVLSPYYQPHKDYENIHRFDPAERWTYREEQAVVRKTDFKIFAWVLVMFFALNLDRGNLVSRTFFLFLFCF